MQDNKGAYMSQFDFNRAQKAMNITKGREKARSAQPGGKRDLKIILGIIGGLILLSVILMLL